MTCDEARPLLNAHMDEETGPIQKAALDSHIGTCFDCAAELKQLERVRDSIRSSMPYYKAPPALRRQVQIALRGAEYLDRDQGRTGWRVLGRIGRRRGFLCTRFNAISAERAKSEPISS